MPKPAGDRARKAGPHPGGRTNILNHSEAYHEPWKGTVAFGHGLLPFWTYVLTSKIVVKKL